MSEISPLFLQIRARHGHYCPMSTLGARLGEAAVQALGGAGDRLTARYLIGTCAVDGVALATGCLPEAGRMVVDNRGRHCLELWDAGTGQGVQAELTAVALERAAQCRTFQEQGAVAAAEMALAALRSDPLQELVTLAPLPR